MTQLPTGGQELGSGQEWYRPYSFNNVLEVAWGALKSRYGMLLGLGVLYAAIVIVVSIATNLLDQMLMGTSNPRFKPISGLSNFLVAAPLAVGVVYIGAGAVRGHRVEVKDLFIGFTRYWVVVGIAFLLWVIMVGLTLVILIPTVLIGGAAGAGGGSGLLILMIPLVIAMVVAMVYLTVRLWFATIVAVDPLGPQGGVVDSIKLSWEMTRKRSLSLFLLAMFLALVFLISALLLILPAIFFAMPFVIAAWGAAYALTAAEDGITPLDDVCSYCGYPRPAGQVCPECGDGAVLAG
jgi:hypothetical protein